MALMSINDVKIAVVGLGYVGLPLAVYMARHFPVLGFDVNAGADNGTAGRARSYPRGNRCGIRGGDKHRFLRGSGRPQAGQFFHRHGADADQSGAAAGPEHARKSVRDGGQGARQGRYRRLRIDGISRRHRRHCVPILSSVSGLVFNQDFFAGYSPERINPGDHGHRLSEIIKVTSGSTPEVAELVDQVYSRVVTAGTHRASSIRVAEASKVIENIQRDVNIALINELAQLFQG